MTLASRAPQASAAAATGPAPTPAPAGGGPAGPAWSGDGPADRPPDADRRFRASRWSRTMRALAGADGGGARARRPRSCCCRRLLAGDVRGVGDLDRLVAGARRFLRPERPGRFRAIGSRTVSAAATVRSQVERAASAGRRTWRAGRFAGGSADGPGGSAGPAVRSAAAAAATRFAAASSRASIRPCSTRRRSR